MAEPVSSSPPFPSPSPPAPPADAGSASADLWYVGAIINVVGSVTINLGMNLMKLGHRKRGQLDMPEKEKPPIRKMKVWVVGMTFFITGNVLNFVSFAFAAQSLLAALGSLQLVCNVFFAYYVNEETVTRMIILCTACIIGGCVLLVVFGNQSSETYTVDQLIQFYTLPAYVVYLVMMGVFVFGFYVLYLHSKKVCRKHGDNGVWYGSMLVSYAIFSALLGSQSVLFGKSISVILRTTFTGSNQLGNWYTWVALPLFTFTALFWVTRLNKGLSKFPAMVIVPLFQIAWTLFSIVSGMIYFQEYKGFNMLKAIMFPIGVLVVLTGVLLLTVCGGGKPAPEDEDQAAEAEEEEITTKTSVYDNAVFSARPDADGHGHGHDGAGPPLATTASGQSKLSLGQTLRFMSTWAPPSVAVSPGSNMSRSLAPTESLRQHLQHYQQQQQQQQHRRRGTGGPSDLNATGLSNISDVTPAPSGSLPTPSGAAAAGGGSGEQPYPGGSWRNSTYDRNSTLNRTAQSSTSRISDTSMMSTMRRGLKTVGSRLTSDMGFNMNGLKLALGLGDENLSGVSLFAMPALDFTATAKRKSELHRPSRAGGRASDMAMLSSLPRSRFYKTEPEGLTVIREASGAPGTTQTPSPDLGASLTASSQLAASPAGSQQGGRGAGAGGRAAATAGTSSPDTWRHTPGRHNQQQQQQRTATASPGKPLTEAAMLSLLPGPSFAAARQLPADSGGHNKASAPASPARPGAAGAGGGGSGSPAGSGGASQRSQRPAAAGGLPLPGFRTPPGGPGPGPGPGPGQSGGNGGTGLDLDGAYSASWGPSAAAALAPLPPPPPPQYRSPGPGGAGAGAYEAGPAGGGGGGGGATRGGRSPPLPKPGSLGALLPEGVPLSTANSVMLHESVPGTPPDALSAMQQQQQQQYQQQYQMDRYGGGAAWPAPAPGPRPQSPWPHSSTPPQQRPTETPLSEEPSLEVQISLQEQQQVLQLQLQQQHQALQQQHQQQPQHLQQQVQVQVQHIPMSLLQRAHPSPAMVATGRLPALHLMVPGLPLSQSQLLQHASTVAPPAGSGYVQYGTSSMSYAQMLAGQGYVDTGVVTLHQPGVGMGTTGGGGMPHMAVGGTLSLGGAPGGASPTGVRLLGRSQSQSPYGLSVSRSWAGLSGMSGGGASRQSPLRGTLLGQIQRPLRPWQG